MARLLHEGEYDAAKMVGSKAKASARLGTLRVASLLQEGELANRLFSFPLVEGSEQLFPSSADSLYVSSPEEMIYITLGVKPSANSSVGVSRFLGHVCGVDTLCTESAKELLMCSYLLDRRLDDFVQAIESQTDSLSASMLPVHYREALVLYHQEHPSLQYEDEETEQRYIEFQRLMLSCSSPSEKAYSSRDQFSATYWDYYFFCR